MKIPFDRDGNLLDYVYDCDDKRVDWRENFSFPATLTYEGYRGGRSSMSMVMRDENGRRYPMFWNYFREFLAGNYSPYFATALTVSGNWTFCKRGKNFSIKPEEECTPTES